MAIKEVMPWTWGEKAAFRPNVDVVEKDDAVKVVAELAGLDADDVDVTVTGDSLIISGEKREAREDKGANYYQIERSFGSFRRTIPVSSDIDTDNIQADFDKGILIVTLPKLPEAQQRSKISVKSE